MVKVDAQRRIYLPKELGFKADKAMVVPFGKSFLLIPIPKEFIEVELPESIEELKAKAELKAKMDVFKKHFEKKVS